MTKSAARLIRSFLHNIEGRSAGDDSEMEEGDRSDVDEEIPRFDIKAQDMQGVLQGVSQLASHGG